MRDLPAILTVYGQLDLVLEIERVAAESARNTARMRQIEARQVINDQAYFVLCWGQLEAEIDDKCREAIRRRIAHTNWEQRRAWDLYNPGDRRLSGLSFEDRTALVVDRSATSSRSPWSKIMQYYQLRNRIAHGELRSTRIELNETVQDFYVIAAQLQS